MKKPELLLPAGNFEKMTYAFAYGADAVYLGVPQFSLRARDNGFKNESVQEAVHYAHNLKKKVYLTANVIPHNNKVEPFIAYVEDLLKTCQPDAWIMSDPGIIMKMKEKHPEQLLHLSVQANVVNYASAKFWEKIGVNRIILSREISLNEIQKIREECPKMELEAFVQGSICIAYSGRCLISNYMASRDPNQGTCAHSCRWEYKLLDRNTEYVLEEEKRPGEFMPIDEDENGTYIMNSRDLCAMDHLERLKEVGVNSFKVEGRAKSVYYVALTARAYRKAIDDMMAGRPLDPKNMDDIYATPNRGFISGFLDGNPGASAQRFDDSQPNSDTYQFAGLIRSYNKDKKLIEVEPRNPIFNGQTLEIISQNATQEFQVQNIVDEGGHPVERIFGGSRTYWIPFSQPPALFSLLREKKSHGE